MNISRAGDASASSMVAESTTKVTGIPLAVAWAAQKLFESFDTASDGALSIDEFVQGVKSHVESGDALFSTLLNSYTHNTQGQFDSAAMGDFLDQGRALAEKYGRQSGSAV